MPETAERIIGKEDAPTGSDEEFSDDEFNELQQPIWAVLDDRGCRLINVTYNEAQTSIAANPGTIITAEAASRIS
jgi:hypothetical protein